MPDDMSSSITLGLHRINRLLLSLSSPHLRLPIIHVAGTNGKGSVCAYLESILRSSGYSVGRFTSPYLVEPRDSITIDGTPISASDFRARWSDVEKINEKENVGASAFEQLTATAFLAFARQAESGDPPLDLAVVEVGMGGTGDATNVCPSKSTLVSVITPVELDHQAFLGSTVEEIAKAKAGIIKEGVPVVVGKQAHASVEGVVGDTARAARSEVTFVKSEDAVAGAEAGTSEINLRSSPAASILCRIPLPGAFQIDNASTAASVATTLSSHPHPLSLLPSLKSRLTPDSIRRGIEATRWRGRADWIDIPSAAFSDDGDGDAGVKILVDGAHNPSAAAALHSYLTSLPPAPTSLILALSNPRDPTAILKPLLSGTGASRSISEGPIRLYATTFSAVEGMPWVKPLPTSDILSSTSSLAAHGIDIVPSGSSDTVAEAVKMAVKEGRKGERIVVCGSLYLVADAVRWARTLGVEV